VGPSPNGTGNGEGDVNAQFSFELADPYLSSGRPSTEYWLGTLKFQKDQYDEALGHFNALLSHGRDEMPTNILAETLFAKSVCCMLSLLSFINRCSHVTSSLTCVLVERLNRLQEALETIEHALRINRTFRCCHVTFIPADHFASAKSPEGNLQRNLVKQRIETGIAST
jgi:tetratricopeptide (TPR) repeat protein